jgi:hypothetical protein
MRTASITYAHLHKPLFVPGFGSTKSQLNTRLSDAGTQVQSMSLSEGGTYVTVTFKNREAKIVTAMVPVTNFELLVPTEG